MDTNEIIFYNQTVRPAEIKIPAHNHSCYELVYYHHCNGSIEINGTLHPFSDYTFSFSKPYSMQKESHRTDGSLMFIGFQTKDPLTLEEGVYADDASHTFLKLMQTILKECTEKKQDYEQMLALKISELTLLLKRLAPASDHQNSSVEISVKLAANFLRENYHTKIDFAALAALSGYSADYFRHRFHQKMGLSPQQYLIKIRLEASATLLKKGAGNCTEIAYLCGFSNASQFSAQFKQYFGVTPKQYRLTL